MSGLRTNSPLEQLLEEIRFQRRKELRTQDPGFSCTRNTTYWTDLFVRHFLFQSDRSIDSDDLLFFVRKQGPGQSDLVEVWRRDSKKLPIGDPDIDWEETVCLNLVIHMFDYKITVAICTRTSPNNLQVIKRASHRVWASPSHRRMDQTKSETEEITFPFVCFSVDDHEEAWSDIIVRDGEMVAVELVAVDSKEGREMVVWLGCVHYDGVKRVWETRSSQTVSQRLSQTNLLSMFGQTKERIEYVHLTGPGNNPGHTQLAVTKPRGHGSDTPSSEPGFSLTESLLGAGPGDWEEEDEMVSAEHLSAKMGFTKGHQRRCSDPSASLDTWLRGGVRPKVKEAGRVRHPSETQDIMDKWMAGAVEIAAGDLRDQLDDGTTNPVWTMRGNTQVLHNWKERKRADCVPMRVNLTYITLPWWGIINNILHTRESPMLTF